MGFRSIAGSLYEPRVRVSAVSHRKASCCGAPPKRNRMPIALSASACFIALIAACGFLLGQLFFGSFSLPASIAGAAGLVSAGSTFAMVIRARWAPIWVVRSSVVTLLGVALDAGRYYLSLDTPGNHYAWELVGPFVGCLAFVAYVARNKRASGGRDA
jgi:hypothetical protein